VSTAHCNLEFWGYGSTQVFLTLLITTEAALGILKASRLSETLIQNIAVGDNFSSFTRHHAYDMNYSVIHSTDTRSLIHGHPQDFIEGEELWLAKLGSWTEALAVYEQKLQLHPDDFEAVLGCMRCLDASGDWKQVLDLGEEKWASLSSHSSAETKQSTWRLQKKALRMCARAAWHLSQWDDLEKYSSHLSNQYDHSMFATTSMQTSTSRDIQMSNYDFDAAFYSGILHIHKREWAYAADAIDAARRSMDGRLTALMAESYSRAYPSMVAAQLLAEMEEIVDYKKLEEQAESGSHAHPANRPDINKARERLISVWRDRLIGCRCDADTHAQILAVRSLVLNPGEELEATLELSELFRQSQRFKFAERVLLHPLKVLGADLDGIAFGHNLPESLSGRLDYSRLGTNALSILINRIVVGEVNLIIPSYGQVHEQWSRKVIQSAGGMDR
jgi:hypothetical protein